MKNQKVLEVLSHRQGQRHFAYLSSIRKSRKDTVLKAGGRGMPVGALGLPL